jgi:SIR2-like domain
MQGPSQVRAAVFLGAGASCFAGFPTVESFFKHALPRGGALDELCSQLARRISIHEGTQENLKWPIFNAEKVFGWLEILDEAQRIQSVNGGAQPVNISNGRGLERRADELMSELKREIVRVYGTELSPKILTAAPHNELFKLLDTVIPDTEPLHVFTTNYDGLVEQLFEHWRNGNSQMFKEIRICTGFSSSQPAHWQAKLFEEKSIPGVRLVKLAKLHGSITWKRDSAGRIVDTHWAMPTEHDILLYFGYKSVPEQEPFLALHNLLKSTLLQYDYLIAIGFRFADPYLYELFDLALRANSRLQVICCLNRAFESGSPVSRMAAQFPGRIHLLTSSTGAPVPFGHQDFQESLKRFLMQTGSS